MILATHLGQDESVSALDVTPDQVSFVPAGSGRLVARNFETAVVLRQIKRDINTLLGRPALGIVEPFNDTPADIAAEAIDPIMVAALREVIVRVQVIDPLAAQELTILAPNFSSGPQFIELFDQLGGLASEAEILPPAQVAIEPTRGVRPQTLAIGALVFMGLVGLGSVMYYRSTR